MAPSCVTQAISFGNIWCSGDKRLLDKFPILVDCCSLNMAALWHVVEQG